MEIHFAAQNRDIRQELLLLKNSRNSEKPQEWFFNIVPALSIFPGRYQPSIFDASELNYCVRNGNRWDLAAINTDL